MKPSIRDSSDDNTVESSLPLRKRTRLRAAPSSVSPHKARQQKQKPHADVERRDEASEGIVREHLRSKLPGLATREAEMSTDDNDIDVPSDEPGSSRPPADSDDQQEESPESESQDEECPEESRLEEDASEPEDDQPNQDDSDSPSLDEKFEIEETTAGDLTKSKKKRTPGIVYLSYIPDGLTVAKTRELLGEFGEVKRMYFEPVKKLSAKIRPLHRFREGWVEFGKKKDAKRVAELLNAKPVGGKRRAPYRDCLWSIKYLNRFRWTHLAERLTYEKAVKDQRMRTEIAKAKREAKFYAKTLEQSIRRRKQRQAGDVSEDNPSRIKLRKTDREIREEKPAPAPSEIADKSLLMSIFAKE